MGAFFFLRIPSVPILAIALLTMASVPPCYGAVEDAVPATADSNAAAVDTKPADDALKEGHSLHGEVFNEGPRQAAHLIEGCGVVKFPVTTSNDEARKFFEQGIAQLHGFWYFESERSFRQAAMLDPDCATAYWGMAMSNRSNGKRAKGFIAEAVKRKDKVAKREQMLASYTP